MKNSDLLIGRQLTYLKRQFHLTGRLDKGLLEPASLVDVVLILLLFFITSSSYVVQPGITVNLPEAGHPRGIEFSSLVVTISQEGMIFFDDQRTTVDGLASAFERMSFERRDHTLIIQADESVSNATLVRICNTAMEAGIKDVAIAARLPGPKPVAPDISPVEDE